MLPEISAAERWRRIREEECILIDDAAPPESLGPKGSHKTWCCALCRDEWMNEDPEQQQVRELMMPELYPKYTPRSSGRA